MKKCSHCGGNNLKKIPIPFEVSGDASLNVRAHVDNKSIYDHLEVFICMDCSHIEWFSDKLVVALKEKDSRISQVVICKGWFLPSNTYDCGSFVVN